MKPKCKMESDAKESACPMISLVWGGGGKGLVTESNFTVCTEVMEGKGLVGEQQLDL